MKLLKKKVWAIIILLFLAGVVTYNIRKDNIEDLELQTEYPTLKKEYKIHGVVMFKYDLEANNYRDFLSISRVSIDKEKYSIIAYEIEGYNDYGINEVIEVGDFISKAKGNDTIVVSKKDSNKVYLF